MTNIARGLFGGLLVLSAVLLYSSIGTNSGDVRPPVIGLIGFAIGIWGCIPSRDR